MTILTATGSAGMGSMLITLVLMLAVFYFMLIRPENKRKKEAEQMRSSVKTRRQDHHHRRHCWNRCQREGKQPGHRDRRRSGPDRDRQVGDVHQRDRRRDRQGRGQEGAGGQGKGQGSQEGREGQVSKQENHIGREHKSLPMWFFTFWRILCGNSGVYALQRRNSAVLSAAADL